MGIEIAVLVQTIERLEAKLAKAENRAEGYKRVLAEVLKPEEIPAEMYLKLVRKMIVDALKT